MGLFNFFYKLTNILSNKRKLRVFVIIVLIFLILFCWSRGVFAAVTPQDTEALTNYQLLLQNSMISYLKFMYQTNVTGFNKTDADKLLESLLYNYCWVQPSTSYYGLFDVFIYSPNNRNDNMPSFNTEGVWSIDIDEGTQYPCMLGNVIIKHMYTISNVWQTQYPTPKRYDTQTSYLIPDAFYLIRSTSINDFLAEKGKFSNLTPTYNTKDTELQAITQSGFANQVQAINNVNSTMQEVNSSVEDVNSSVQDVNQSVNEMIETIIAPYVNVSQDQLPTQEVNDTSTEPLNTLFDYIKDAFTGEPQAFSFPLPFVRW